VRKLIDAEGYTHIQLEADGNVSFQNIATMIKSGATMLVGGTSSVFCKQYSIREAIAVVRSLVASNAVQ
jgi:pentose-5-phosphate-3-epimerase